MAIQGTKEFKNKLIEHYKKAESIDATADIEQLSIALSSMVQDTESLQEIFVEVSNRIIAENKEITELVKNGRNYP